MKVDLAHNYIFTSAGVEWGEMLTHDSPNWIVKHNVQSVSMASRVRVCSSATRGYVGTIDVNEDTLHVKGLCVNFSSILNNHNAY